MDEADIAAHTQKVVDTLAMQAMERPAGKRHAFIEHEIAALKQDASREYVGNAGKIASASTFFDKVEEFTKAMVALLEKSGGQTGNA